MKARRVRCEGSRCVRVKRVCADPTSNAGAVTDRRITDFQRDVCLPARVAPAGNCSEQALFLLFLASDAVTGPRHCFQALLLQLLMAGNALAEFASANPRE